MSESELDVGGSNMTVELRGDELHASANTGNKQWVAVITDTHPKYNYDRDWAAYQKPKTTDRDSGAAPIADGDVIERVRYTHSGKNRTDEFYQLVDGEAHAIDEADVKDALDGEIVPDVDGDDAPATDADDETPTVMADGGGEVEVEYGGQAVTVPTTIRRSDLAGYFGSVADTCPVEYIYVYDGRLRAEGQADETTRVIATYRPDRVDSVGSGWDGWGAELVDGAAEGTPPNTLWERDNQRPMTDGGEVVEEDDGDDPKTLRELGGRHGDAVVRSYSADGTLYAYREDDEHVVVSNGREPGDKWTRRVPAERTAVTPGEHLWTVPGNWECRVTIDGAGASRYAIHHIPETDVGVLVSVPHKNHLVDAWYGVKSVGELTVTYADECNWDVLDDALGRYGDEMDDDVREALERLLRRSTIFEHRLADSVDEFAEEALFERRDAASLNGWTTEPWGDHRFDEDGHLLGEFLGIDGDTLSAVRRELSDMGQVIPSYPTVEVGVDDSEQLPDGFASRALIEAGCSPPEAIDYRHVEGLDLSQSEWGRVRDRDQSTVSENVKQATRKLKR